MWATSDAFEAALNSTSRRWSSRIEVLYRDEVVTALDVVTEGKVAIDAVAVRRQCDLTAVDLDGSLTPADASDLLAPKGTELRVLRGLEVAGAVEWVPLGVFGISAPEVSASSTGGTQLKLKAFDRVDAIRLRRFAAPYALAKGTPTGEAIAAIVTSRLDVPVRITPTGSTTPAVVFEALSDPWDAVRELAEADSMVAYFDPQGTLVVGPDEPVETGVRYEVGPTSLLLSSGRGMDATKTYSGVVVTGENPDETPLRFELWDTDPASPTYAAGPFGRRPYGYSSSLLSSLDQASKAAATILARVSRIPQTATLTTVGHIGHDVGDVIEVADPRSRTGGRWRVIGASIPLRPGEITLKLEEVTA